MGDTDERIFRFIPKSMWIIITKALCECYGTGILVHYACMSLISGWNPEKPPSHSEICIAICIVAMFCLSGVLHISGGHINPCVTAAAVPCGKISLTMAGLYIVSQCIGGTIGFALLKVITPADVFDPYFPNSTVKMHKFGLCSNHVPVKSSVWQAFAMEFGTAFVLGVICGGCWDHRNSNKHDSVSIRLGFTIGGLLLVGAHHSSGGLNPARSIGPAIVNNYWESHWIFWLGPMLGGYLGGLWYMFFWHEEKPDD